MDLQRLLDVLSPENVALAVVFVVPGYVALEVYRELFRRGVGFQAWVGGSLDGRHGLTVSFWSSLNKSARLPLHLITQL